MYAEVWCSVGILREAAAEGAQGSLLRCYLKDIMTGMLLLLSTTTAPRNRTRETKRGDQLMQTTHNLPYPRYPYIAGKPVTPARSVQIKRVPNIAISCWE